MNTYRKRILTSAALFILISLSSLWLTYMSVKYAIYVTRNYKTSTHQTNTREQEPLKALLYKLDSIDQNFTALVDSKLKRLNMKPSTITLVSDKDNNSHLAILNTRTNWDNLLKFTHYLESGLQSNISHLDIQDVNGDFIQVNIITMKSKHKRHEFN